MMCRILRYAYAHAGAHTQAHSQYYTKQTLFLMVHENTSILSCLPQCSFLLLQVWAGETAMAYHGGQNLTTNAFASTLWYAFQLGALASLNQKAFCRQAMVIYMSVWCVCVRARSFVCACVRCHGGGQIHH